MVFRFFLLCFCIAFQALAASTEVEEIPHDRVLPLKAQENLFVQAYAAVNPETLHPLKTIVPGLAPMVRMHYSYVREFLEAHSPEHLPVLKQLWGKASKVIEENRLTVARVHLMAAQLAMLLSEAQGTSELDEMKMFLDRAAERNVEEDWKDLDCLSEPSIYGGGFEQLYPINLWNYRNHGISDQDWYSKVMNNPDRELRTGPGFCEAILCCPSGGFSYERFVRNYIGRSFPLSIAALPFNIDEKGGVHGGNIRKSLRFFNHEHTHTKDFAHTIFGEEERKGSHPEILDQYPPIRDLGPWVVTRDLFRKVAQAPGNSTRNQAALFLLLHEEYASLFSSHAWLGEEDLLPPSERRLFWTLVAGVANRSSLENFFIDNFNNNHYKQVDVPASDLSLEMKIDSIEREGNKTHLIGHWNCMQKPRHGGPLTFLRSNIAGFSFDVSYAEGVEDNIVGYDGPNPIVNGKRAVEFEGVSNFSPITWNDPEGILTPDHKAYVEKEVRKPSNPSSRLFSRDYYYRQFMMDDERKIRDIYGDDASLPPVSAHVEERAWALHQAMQRFWRDFYQENKGLFSIQPYPSTPTL